VQFSRREFVKVSTLAGTFWACRTPRGLFAATPASPASPCLVHAGSGYAPFIEPFRKQIRPGADEFVAEKYAANWRNCSPHGPVDYARDRMTRASCATG